MAGSKGSQERVWTRAAGELVSRSALYGCGRELAYLDVAVT